MEISATATMETGKEVEVVVGMKRGNDMPYARVKVDGEWVKGTGKGNGNGHGGNGGGGGGSVSADLSGETEG